MPDGAAPAGRWSRTNWRAPTKVWSMKFNLGVARGLARRIPDRFDGQPDQPQRQFGGQVAGGAPGIAIVDAHAVGEAPARENVAEHRLNRLGGDVFPPAVGGGNFGGQDGPRGLIGHRQPAAALAGGQRHILDGVDLPDLMGLDRLGDHDSGPAAVLRPIDSGPHEGELETSDRGQAPLVHVLAELEPDQAVMLRQAEPGPSPRAAQQPARCLGRASVTRPRE